MEWLGMLTQDILQAIVNPPYSMRVYMIVICCMSSKDPNKNPFLTHLDP